MSNKITAPDGSKWRWKDGEWVKADVKRGPLGGELKPIHQLNDGDYFYIPARWKNDVVVFKDPHLHDYSNSVLSLGTLVETNIPPRLAGERMTAGQAAQVPGVVGRWAAERVEGVEPELGSYIQPLKISGRWLHEGDDLILLPEGFGE
jgi:hypothetical protein